MDKLCKLQENPTKNVDLIALTRKTLTDGQMDVGNHAMT